MLLSISKVTVYAQERKALTVPTEDTYPSANEVWRNATGSKLEDICKGEAANATDQNARESASPIRKQGGSEQVGVIKEGYDGKVFYIFNKKYGKFLASGGKYGQSPILSETGSRYWVEKRDFTDENEKTVTRYFFHDEQQQPTSGGNHSGEFLGMTQRYGNLNGDPMRDLVNDKAAFPGSSAQSNNIWNAGASAGTLYPAGGTAAWAVTPVDGSTDNLYTMSLRYEYVNDSEYKFKGSKNTIKNTASGSDIVDMGQKDGIRQFYLGNSLTYQNVRVNSTQLYNLTIKYYNASNSSAYPPIMKVRVNGANVNNTTTVQSAIEYRVTMKTTAADGALQTVTIPVMLQAGSNYISFVSLTKEEWLTEYPNASVTINGASSTITDDWIKSSGDIQLSSFYLTPITPIEAESGTKDGTVTDADDATSSAGKRVVLDSENASITIPFGTANKGVGTYRIAVIYKATESGSIKWDAASNNAPTNANKTISTQKTTDNLSNYGTGLFFVYKFLDSDENTEKYLKLQRDGNSAAPSIDCIAITRISDTNLLDTNGDLTDAKKAYEFDYTSATFKKQYVDFHMAPSEEYDGEEEVTLWREKTVGSWATSKQYLKNDYAGLNGYTDPTETAKWVDGADEWKFITVKDYHDQFIMQAQTAQLTGAAVSMNAAYMVRDAHFDRNNQYDQAWTWYHKPKSSGEGFNASNTYYTYNNNVADDLKAYSLISSSAIQDKDAAKYTQATGAWTQDTKGTVSTDNDFNQTAHIGVGQNSQSEFVKYDGTNDESVQGQYGKYFHFRGNAKTRLAQTTTVEVTGNYEFKVKALYVATADNAKEDLSKSFLFVTRKSEGGVVQTVTSRDTKNNNYEAITQQSVQGGTVSDLSSILKTTDEQNLAHDYSYYAIGKALRDDDNGKYDLSVKVYLMKGDKVTFGVHLGDNTGLDDNGLPVDDAITDWKRHENFVALDNFRIYYQGEKQIYLGEEKTDYNYLQRPDENYKNAKAILHRSFNATKYNTIVLPFSLSSDQLKDAFGSDVTLWKFSGPKAEGSSYVIFTKEDIDASGYETKAFMPYLIYVSNAPKTAPLQVLIPDSEGKVSQRINLGDTAPADITGVEEVTEVTTSSFVGGDYKGYYEIPGVTFVKPTDRTDLTKLEGNTENGNHTSNASTLKFYGTLFSSTGKDDLRAQANDYVMSDGQFVLATNGAALQGYRCWIGATKVSEDQSEGAKPLFLTIEEVMDIDGTTPTDISKDTISFSIDPTVAVYNTAGQYVGTMPISNIQKLPMGVYVANKHKIVVK